MNFGIALWALSLLTGTLPDSTSPSVPSHEPTSITEDTRATVALNQAIATARARRLLTSTVFLGGGAGLAIALAPTFPRLLAGNESELIAGSAALALLVTGAWGLASRPELSVIAPGREATDSETLEQQIHAAADVQRSSRRATGLTLSAMAAAVGGYSAYLALAGREGAEVTLPLSSSVLLLSAGLGVLFFDRGAFELASDALKQVPVQRLGDGVQVSLSLGIGKKTHSSLILTGQF